MRICNSFFISLLWLLQSSPICFAAEPAKFPFPPVIQDNVRWQKLPWQYDDVFLDHELKPWFHLHYGYQSQINGGHENSSDVPVMTCLVSPELPEDTIEIPKGNFRLGFDRTGRFWEIGKFGLAATDPRRGTFLQHRPLEPLSEQAARATKRAKHLFFPFMFEHSQGRLYFIDYFGIHCLEKEEWSVHRFASAPLNSSLQYSSSALQAVEAPDGRFFLWCPYRKWLDALIIHDGHEWSQITIEQEPRLAELKEVLPQRDGTIRFRSLSEGEFELDALNRKRAEPYPAVPEVTWTSDRSLRGGTNASLATDGPMSVDGRVVGKDAEGRIFIKGNGEPNPFDVIRPVIVFNPQVSESLPRLPVEIIPLDHSGPLEPLTDDGQGRLWAQTVVDQKPCLSRYSQGQWTHFPAPPSLEGEPPMPVDESRELSKDGSLWVMRPVDAPDDWKLDRPECFVGLPCFANTALIQPLADDYVIAQEQKYSNRCYFFDGQHWTGYASPYELVEAHYEILSEKLSNISPAVGNESYRWGRDALGRIWIQGYIREPAKAYDGEQWEELPFPYFKLDRAGKLCLSQDILYDTSVTPPCRLGSSRRSDENSPAPFIHLISHHSRYWKVHDTLPSGAKLPEKFLRSNALNGITEDAAGRYWLESSHALWVIRSDGAAARLDHKTACFHRALAQQSENMFWAIATDGLIQFRLHDQPGQPLRLEQMNFYPRNVPQRSTAWMFIDDREDLWIRFHSTEYGLCRIKLPPLDSPDSARQKGK